MSGAKWTESEKDFIINNYAQCKDAELAEKINEVYGTQRSAISVCRMRKALGLGTMFNKPWAKEEDDYLLECLKTCTYEETAELHRSKFSAHRTKYSVMCRLRALQRCGKTQFKKGKDRAVQWSEEEKRFIVENVNGVSFKELADMHNAAFPIKRTEFACQRQACKLGVGNGRDTKAKIGDKPPNEKIIGSRVVDGNGDIWIKVDNKPIDNKRNHNTYLRNYIRLSQIEWEKHNPPLKADEKLLFLDGNHSNCDISNLVLVTDAIIARMAHHGFHSIDDPKLKKCAVQLEKLNQQIFEVKKGR